MEFEGYCTSCRKSVTVKNGKETTTSKGRLIIKGACPICGTRVAKFQVRKR